VLPFPGTGSYWSDKKVFCCSRTGKFRNISTEDL
jgi:hypothetical protein